AAPIVATACVRVTLEHRPRRARTEWRVTVKGPFLGGTAFVQPRLGAKSRDGRTEVCPRRKESFPRRAVEHSWGDVERDDLPGAEPRLETPGCYRPPQRIAPTEVDPDTAR